MKEYIISQNWHRDLVSDYHGIREPVVGEVPVEHSSMIASHSGNSPKIISLKVHGRRYIISMPELSEGLYDGPLFIGTSGKFSGYPINGFSMGNRDVEYGDISGIE